MAASQHQRANAARTLGRHDRMAGRRIPAAIGKEAAGHGERGQHVRHVLAAQPAQRLASEAQVHAGVGARHQVDHRAGQRLARVGGGGAAVGLEEPDGDKGGGAGKPLHRHRAAPGGAADPVGVAGHQHRVFHHVAAPDLVGAHAENVGQDTVPVDPALQRFRDGPGLLEYFLQHVMLEVPLGVRSIIMIQGNRRS